jgi:hypothetical protein
LADGTVRRAQVVRFDTARDVALLQLAGAPLRALPIGTDIAVRPGDHLLSLGFALDLPGEPTLTSGIVSAIRQIDGVTFIQTDTTPNPGNSGGPLLSFCGVTVGSVVGGLRNATGLNFALSGSEIHAFLGSAPSPTPAPPPSPTLAPAPTPTPQDQIAKVMDGYFAALNTGDFAGAYNLCCTPRWKAQHPQEEFRSNFVGVADLRPGPPRFDSLASDKIDISVDYSFLSGGMRLYFTLRWTMVPSGDRWLADDTRSVLSLTPTPTAPTDAGSDPRQQIVRLVDSYFAALNAADYNAAYSMCCTANWRARHPLAEFTSNFVGVSEFGHDPPRFDTVQNDRVQISVPYSFSARGKRFFYTLGWTLIPVAGRWLAQETTAICAASPCS